MQKNKSLILITLLFFLSFHIKSFDKKGLRIKKRGVLQSFIIKPPMDIDYENDSVDTIVEKLQFAIEQHPSLLNVIPESEFFKEDEFNKNRKWEY